MLEYLKKLPDGVSLSYVVLKLLDGISKDRHHTGLWFYIDDNEFFNRDPMEDRTIELTSYIGFRKDKKSQRIAPHIAIPSKFSKKRKVDFGNFKEDLFITDRDLIEGFYKEVEDSFKEQDLTKLILTIGKDPFKMNEWLTVLFKEEHHKFKENIFTLKLRDIK